MKTSALSRYALAIGAAAALLTGCGGSQPPIGAPGAVPQSRSVAKHADRSGSWMLPEAKSEDLVYAEGGGCGGVCILSYSDGMLVGSIALSGGVGGDCSDSQGNVFITNGTQVLEFAHGGTSPIATLALPGTDAVACGVDPKTGNLAVIFGGGSAGNIAIFANATGSPTLYTAGIGPYFCGYDNNGNLFVDGLYSRQIALVELLYRSASFTPLTINGDVGDPGQIQWDGSYITYEGRVPHHIKISRLSVSGTTVNVVGTTHLKDVRFAHQSWLAASRVILPYSTQGFDSNKISVWRYPKGGKAVVKFGNFGQQTQFLGVTLSKA